MGDQHDLEDDDVLAERLLAGDERAVEYVKQKMEPQLRRLAWARGRAKCRDDEDDFIQEFLFRFVSVAWRTLKNWKETPRGGRLMGYLLRAANNMAIDTGVRRQRDSNHVEYNETHSSLQFGSEASLVAKLDADRVLQILESVQLPPRQRLVFDREILGVPKEQTLAETGMSGEAYEQNLSRARKSANEHLRKAGLR